MSDNRVDGEFFIRALSEYYSERKREKIGERAVREGESENSRKIDDAWRRWEDVNIT